MTKRIIPFISAVFMLVLAGCCQKPKDDCIHCVGCFNSWTECESEWHNDSITWEEHRDQKIAESQYNTDQCELVRE